MGFPISNPFSSVPNYSQLASQQQLSPINQLIALQDQANIFNRQQLPSKESEIVLRNAHNLELWKRKYFRDPLQDQPSFFTTKKTPFGV